MDSSASQGALGYLTSYSYSYDGAGKRTLVREENGKLTTTAYFKNRNLPQATIDAMGFRTTYGYDSQSRLVTTMDARGGIITNVYDSAGRLSIVKNQLGENVRQYGCDNAGRIVTQMDAANRCRTFTFDAAGQNTVIQFPDGNRATYGYDSIGRRTTMVDWGGTSTYVYDTMNRMSGKTDAAGFVQGYGYDANGNRTTLTLTGVGTISYTYDSLNRLDMAQKPTGERYSIAYDNDSRRTTMLLGNGTTRKYAYDSNSRLTTQIEFSGATPICTIIDGYDSVGNRITRNLDGNPTTWTYDNLYRLTGQNKSGQVCTYVMDAVGNLEVMWEGSSSSPKTFTFDLADKISTMAEGSNLTTYTWTGYGALDAEITGSRRTTYTYNGQDQLTKVQTSQMTSTYTFDGDGLRRTAQEGNVQPTTMVWDGSDYLFLDGPSSDQLVLSLDSEIVSCGSKDLLTDPLGSLVKEISSGASLGSLIEMYPYGTLVSGTGTPTVPFVYIAKHGYYNDSTARDYVRARELYKMLGRWMQIDRLLSLSNSAYGYATAAPSVLTDRSGLWPLLGPCAIPGAIKEIICKLLSTITPKQIDAVLKCYSDSKLIGLDCDPFGLGIFDDLKDLCKPGGTNLICDCTNCKGHASEPCATHSVSGGVCTVKLCFPRAYGPACGDNGSIGNPDNNISFNIIHEMLHCAGFDHGTNSEGNPPPPGYECNDILACCIAAVLYGFPSDKCKRLG